MTTLLEQIEAMRVRMTELGTQEHGIVRTLGEALAAVDLRLLDEIRSVAAAHDARRGAILGELKMLARRMGTLHSPQPQADALEDASPQGASQQTDPNLNGGADWRQAAANIRDELDNHFRTQPQISHVGH
jgi:hypothetical protein